MPWQFAELWDLCFGRRKISPWIASAQSSALKKPYTVRPFSAVSNSRGIPRGPDTWMEKGGGDGGGGGGGGRKKCKRLYARYPQFSQSQSIPKNLHTAVRAILKPASSAHELQRRRWRRWRRRRSRYPTLNRGIARRAGWQRRRGRGRESRSLIIRIPRAPWWTYGDDRITPSARP